MARIAAMMNAIGLARRQRAEFDEDQHAQNLLGGVRHRGERVRRKDRKTRDSGETFVVGQMRGNRLADDKALDLTEEAFFRHDRASREAACWSPEKQKAAARCGFQPEVRFR